MRFASVAPLLLLSWLMLTPEAAAQSARFVTPGERVRVETTDSRLIEGMSEATGAEMVRLNRDGERLDFAVADIRRAWVQRRSTRSGAIIGGVVGLAAGITYGLLITRPESSPCDADNCTRTGVTVASGLIGAAVGAGAGALIGSLIPRWQLRFP